MRRAITLIETLAAIAILALETGAFAIGLAGAGARARITEAVGAVRDMDQLARSLSQTDGELALRHDDHRVSLLRQSEWRVGRLAQRPLPRAIEVSLEQSATAVDTIWFDRFGRCQDYTVHIRGPGHVVGLQVSGLTGWMEEW